MNEKNIKKLLIIISVFLLILSTIYIIFIVIPMDVPEEIVYTSFYERIDVGVAKQLIETNLNLTVVDCTGGCQSCAWKKGKLPRAEWIDQPELLYNATEDLLVYSYDGVKSITFCEQLVNHTYGKIYHLDGGLIAWNKS